MWLKHKSDEVAWHAENAANLDVYVVFVPVGWKYDGPREQWIPRTWQMTAWHKDDCSCVTLADNDISPFSL
jgi:hypothetical protein